MGQSLQRLTHNSAAWIAALERLATQRPTSLAPPTAGPSAVEDAPSICGDAENAHFDGPFKSMKLGW